MSGRQKAAEYACAIIIKDGKTLLGRRAHFRAAYPNCWDFIGGKIEAGETAEQALIRELGEEIAIIPKNTRYFDKIVDVEARADQPPTYNFFTVREWDGGAPIINNHEHSHLEWFTHQQACDLSNLALPEAYRNLLSAALA
ncbi:MAG: NUDIX domain-containing protein [Rhodobacteraceae bacterium]|uniref:NUDIX domain-containing protein n=1 Tax=Planktotalea sp. TaxID=2029877 RepID=UPI000183AE27|nr:NUDIX domain-containing protein [Planktotalea sp.]EDZ44026.1 putative NTP pyrophosphohydrolase protein, MutT/nudix family [Rhodobacteraceae bacterium HTCC2083]MBT5822103.1 NUDIX domain-containing protein [Paracoccaceae bacterium]MDG1084233.1 NUDIX domain-containing protein [Planktotalea sp.]HCW84271.1 NUDIX domain-containing protein [Paracoccaceae bacterium]